ncbi:MAG: hypothetical protein L0154_30975 [Chloroflexi bacterium]|nr:hypothetical protein [Chloroflexota bacterium]
MRWMGIDGGGTSLRVVIVDDNLNEIASLAGDGVNPNSVGPETAQFRIRQAVRDVLHQAGLSSVDSVAIGIAGASNEHSTDWLLQTLQPVLPDSVIVPSSDMEIALVSARGRLDGILLLAGTGSVALGISPAGHHQRIGGWGYLLGDEGSGYWIGTQALQFLTRWLDGLISVDSQLPLAVMQHLNLTQSADLIRWRYQQATTSDVAALTPLVMQLAGQEDKFAAHIISGAADHLVDMARRLLENLNLNPDSIVFAGSLLTNDTLLQKLVCHQLNLRRLPASRYPPAIGAALLAKLKGKLDAD